MEPEADTRQLLGVSGMNWISQRRNVELSPSREFQFPVPTAAPFFSLTTCLSWSGHRAEAQGWPEFAGGP